MNSTPVSLPESVSVTEGGGGLPVVRVSTPVANGEVYLNGAHVAAWSPVGADPVIWMSGSSNFVAGKAIRGGIPICFPWFGPGREPGMAPAHGFARLAQWRLTAAHEEDGSVTLTFALTDDDVAGVPGAEHWPHRFLATYTVSFGRELTVALRVENTGDAELSFEEALHAYFAVADIRSTTVQGLGGAKYRDTAPGAGTDLVTQDGDVTFTGETDRIYASACTVVIDEAARRTIQVTKVNSVNTVVWNPWTAKAASMPDLGDDEWPGMLCVETANALDDAVTLAPGASHTMQARYTVS